MAQAQTELPPIGGDSEFVQFWNEVLGPKFNRFRHILVGGLTHHSEAVFPKLPVREGDRAVDVGCGWGDTAMQLARMVGPRGSVTGIDCCDMFLDIAREELAGTDLENVTFVRGDAEVALPEGAFDFAFARFGTMFFANPVAGLRNMRRSLKPEGRMVHIVWRDPKDNPWLSMAKEVVLRFLPPPGEGARTCGPGPFSMADETMVHKMMEIAGYADITFERIDAPVLIGRNVKDAIDFQLAIGPAGEVFREAGDEAERQRPQIEAALAEAIDRQKREADGIVMESSSWMISARNPGG
jgi:ubiquinone/menaquinone biosynthesis C-methylase UbiE